MLIFLTLCGLACILWLTAIFINAGIIWPFIITSICFFVGVITVLYKYTVRSGMEF